MLRILAFAGLTAIILIIMPGLAQDSQMDSGLVVIVNPSNPVNQLSAGELQRVYLGKRGFWEWGKAIKAVDLIEQNRKEEDSSRSVFSSVYLGKSLAVLKSYWTRAIFSGKGQPPLVFGKSSDVISYVAENVEAIGYVPKADLQSEKVKRLSIISMEN